MAHMKTVSEVAELIKGILRGERSQTTVDIKAALQTVRIWNDELFQEVVQLRCQVDALQRIVHGVQSQISQSAQAARSGAVAQDQGGEGVERPETPPQGETP